MSCILVNDIFDELLDENERLLNELSFADKCINLLNELKIFFELNSNQIKLNLVSNQLKVFNDLCIRIEDIFREKNSCVIEVKEEVNEMLDLEEEVNEEVDQTVDQEVGIEVNEEVDQVVDLEEDEEVNEELISDGSVAIHGSQEPLPSLQYFQTLIPSPMTYQPKPTNFNTLTVPNPVIYQTKSINNNDTELKKKITDKNNEEVVTIVKKVTPIVAIKAIDGQLVCPIEYCGKRFPKKRNLICHLPRHQRAYDLKCDWTGCDFKTRDEFLLTDHKREHFDSKPFECPECHKKFKYKESIDKHTKRMHNLLDQPLICDIDGCNKVFRTELSFQSHRSLHQRVEKYVCDHKDCDFKTAYPQVLRDHEMKHLVKRPFVCTVPGCGRGYAERAALKRHLKRYHNLNIKTRPNTTKHLTFQTFPLVLNPNLNSMHSKDSDSAEEVTPDLQISDSGTEDNLSLSTDTNKPDKEQRSDTFECLKCHQQFQTESLLNLHLEVYHKPLDQPLVTPLVCDIDDCHKEFRTEKSLKSHRYMYHEIRERFVCQHPGCGFKATCPKMLSDHQLRHTVDLPFECTVEGCSRRYMTRTTLNFHVKHCHTSEAKTYWCTHNGCEKSFPNEPFLRDHIRKVHLAVLLECDWPGCDFKTKTKFALNNHIAGHGSDMPFACTMADCDKRYKTKTLLLLHIRTHNRVKNKIENTEKTFECNECHRKFLTKSLRNIHFERIHKLLDEPLVCDIDDCDRQFRTEFAFQSHRSVMHERGRPFACDHPNCTFTARYAFMVRDHEKRHSDPRPFACTVDGCDRRYANPKALRVHAKHYHKPNIETYSCTYGDCTKTFLNELRLRSHIREVHLFNESKYIPCDWPGCEYKAKSNKYMIIHMTRHRSDRPFACTWDNCDKRFKTKRNLVIHIRVHQGLKKYSCNYPECQFRSVYSNNVKAHTKAMHKS